ncbi:MAG: Lrp/AsnC ligand binding domain-containing protein [Candidatus Marsarchaeota archaeon]|nr:Lrp/AsnC ligand binding domain-containing protein [Candidatus Marsarchaeota archaeon]
MALAYVLVNTEIGGEDEVLNEVKNIPAVKVANVVYGVYDLVLMVEDPQLDKLKEIVTNKIRKIPKVRSTLTMIVVESS